MVLCDVYESVELDLNHFKVQENRLALSAKRFFASGDSSIAPADLVIN